MKASDFPASQKMWSQPLRSQSPVSSKRAKAVLALGALLSLAPLQGNGQVTLCAGSSYSYQFDTLAFGRNATFGVAEPSAAVFLYIDPWSPTLLDPTNSYQVEMFEDTSAQVPILSRIITAASSIHDTSYRVPNAWGDLQGSIRVTALSGCIKLGGFSFQAITAGDPEGFDIYATDRIFLPASPHLSVVQSNGFLTLRWPASATNYTLESSDVSQSSWQAVTNAAMISETGFSVAIPMEGPGRLFRLKAQP